MDGANGAAARAEMAFRSTASSWGCWWTRSRRMITPPATRMGRSITLQNIMNLDGAHDTPMGEAGVAWGRETERVFEGSHPSLLHFACVGEEGGWRTTRFSHPLQTNLTPQPPLQSARIRSAVRRLERGRRARRRACSFPPLHMNRSAQNKTAMERGLGGEVALQPSLVSTPILHLPFRKRRPRR